MLSWHNEDFARMLSRTRRRVFSRPCHDDPLRLRPARPRCLSVARPGLARAHQHASARAGPRRRPRRAGDSCSTTDERRHRRRADARQSRRRGLRPGALQRAGARRRPTQRCGASSRRPPARRPITWPGPPSACSELGARPSLLNPLWYRGRLRDRPASPAAPATRQPGLRRRDRAPGRTTPRRPPRAACPPPTSPRAPSSGR